MGSIRNSRTTTVCRRFASGLGRSNASVHHHPRITRISIWQWAGRTPAFSALTARPYFGSIAASIHSRPIRQTAFSHWVTTSTSQGRRSTTLVDPSQGRRPGHRLRLDRSDPRPRAHRCRLERSSLGARHMARRAHRLFHRLRLGCPSPVKWQPTQQIEVNLVPWREFGRVRPRQMKGSAGRSARNPRTWIASGKESLDASSTRSGMSCVIAGVNKPSTRSLISRIIAACVPDRPCSATSSISITDAEKHRWTA